MSSDLADKSFITSFVSRFQLIEKEFPKEISVERERNFRVSLAQHVFGALLGWTRVEGQGHYVVAEKHDITLYDDEKFPVIIVETKDPDVDLQRADERQLRDYLEETGSARYGVLSNWRKLILYEYGVQIGWKTIANIDVERVIQKGVSELSSNETSQILELKRLERRRFVNLEDSQYFEENYKQISVLKEKEEGIKALTDNLGKIIINLTDVMKRFFEAYRKRSIHHSREFLDKAFGDWLKVSGKERDWEEESQRTGLVGDFCRETAYVVIGRILFTRICEDKEISNPLISGKTLSTNIQAQLLLGITGTEYLNILASVYEHIEDYYEHFYKLGVFDWWKLTQIEKGLLSEDDRRNQVYLERELNNVVRDTLRVLNRFDFSRVDKDILKDVYQKYLPKDERKRLGEFYTPDEVITYILDAVGYTADNDIETKFLLDPACGSGSFLVEALRRLIQRYEIKGFNLKDPIVSRNVLDDIVNRIYGLDINPFACFIAEMNILFQIVDLYGVVKKKHRDYRIKRFKIYQTDSLASPLTKEQKETMELELIKTTNSRAKSFIEENMMADLVKETKFNFVVGNPPYVRVQRIDSEIKCDYREHYRSARGKFDIYVVFLERGIQWLLDGGNLGFITSNRFVQTDYGKDIRKYIIDNCAIREIIDFGDTGVFAEVTNYPSIIILQKPKIKQNIMKVVKAIRSRENFLDHVRKHIFELEYEDDYVQLFDFEQGKLNEGFWQLIPKTIEILLNKIVANSTCKLGTLCELISDGIQTSVNEVYIVTQEDIQKNTLEKNLLKPVIKGENVRRWRITFDDLYLIYPHTGGGKALEENILKEAYPHIYEFLKRHENKLRARKYLIDAGRKWYEHWCPRNPEWFETAKIVTPDISTSNNFAFDDKGFYGTNTLFVILMKDKRPIFIKYIVGLLNSRTLEFYFKNVSPFLSGGYYRYITQYLEQLPIVLEDGANIDIYTNIAHIVDQILQLNEELNILLDKIEEFPDSYFSGKGEKLWVVAKSAPTKFSKGIYRFSEKDLQIETVREITGEDSNRLKMTKNECIVFRTFNEALYAQKLLRKKCKVTKQEFLGLEIPSKDDLDRIMNQYDQDMKKIEESKETSKKLEGEINELVYELYGLDSDDKKTIKEYLSKF